MAKQTDCIPDDALPPRHALSCDWAGLRWYALRTTVRSEGHAAAGLRARGFEVFAPTFRRWVRPRRRTGPLAQRWRQTERPLFTRYVFAGFPSDAIDWMALRTIPAVIGPVSFDGAPARISASAIARINQWVGLGYFDQDDRNPSAPIAALAVNDSVSIKIGPVGGIAANVASVHGKERRLKLHIPGSSLTIIVRSE